jgi:hypothetical protein
MYLCCIEKASVCLLSACTDNVKEEIITEVKDNPPYFEDGLDPDLPSSLEFQYIAEDGSSQLIRTPQPLTVQKGK